MPTDLVKISVKEATHMGFHYTLRCIRPFSHVPNPIFLTVGTRGRQYLDLYKIPHRRVTSPVVALYAPVLGDANNLPLVLNIIIIYLFLFYLFIHFIWFIYFYFLFIFYFLGGGGRATVNTAESHQTYFEVCEWIKISSNTLPEDVITYGYSV